MLLHGIEDPSFVRHDNTLARPYISYTHRQTASTSCSRILPSAGKEELGSSSNFPTALPHPRDGGPFPRPHHSFAEARRTRRGRPTRRLALRRRGQDAPQGDADGGVQPAHHRSPAQLVSSSPTPRSAPTSCSSRRARPTEGHLVLRAPSARRTEGVFDDEADPDRAFPGMR